MHLVPPTPSFLGKLCGFPISTTTLLSSFTSLPPSLAPTEVAPGGESLRWRRAPAAEAGPCGGGGPLRRAPTATLSPCIGLRPLRRRQRRRSARRGRAGGGDSDAEVEQASDLLPCRIRRCGGEGPMFLRRRPLPLLPPSPSLAPASSPSSGMPSSRSSLAPTSTSSQRRGAPSGAVKCGDTVLPAGAAKRVGEGVEVLSAA
jgi:hypothetical protein